MGLEDTYTAYCFNEACAYVMFRLDKGDKIIRKAKKAKARRYSSFSELYKQFD